MTKRTLKPSALGQLARNSYAIFLAFLLTSLAANSAFAASHYWRQQALDETRRAASFALARPPKNLPATLSGTLNAPAPWQLAVRLYENGLVVAQASGAGKNLRQAARLAGQNLAAQGKITRAQLTKVRWFLTVRGPKVDGSLVSYRGKALEIVGDVTVVRVLSRSLVRKAIFEQKEYLHYVK